MLGMQGVLANVPRTEARAALVSLSVGVLLLIVKFTAYAMTGSAAIFSDAMESIINVLASTMALYALGVAHRPADGDHPYGHGKVEFLSAGFEGSMILLAGGAICFKAVDMIFFHPVRIEQLEAGMALTVAALAVNGGVGVFLIHTGRQQQSLTLEADGQHLVSDAITSVGALAALVLVKWTGWFILDPLVAVGMAGVIVWTGGGLLRRSIAGLMDEQDASDGQRIKDIVNAHVGPHGKEPRICECHKVRHRHSGRFHWVEFHVHVPATMSVEQGHRVGSAIEHEIEQAITGKATAHVEPCTLPGCASCARALGAR